jgi:hypothetical protein
VCAHTESSLVVWNLLTASVWWSAAVAVSSLAVDAQHGMFAVAVPPQPVRRWSGSQAGPANAAQRPGTGPDRLPNGHSAAAVACASMPNPTSTHAAASTAPGGGLVNGFGGGSSHMNGVLGSPASSMDAQARQRPGPELGAGAADGAAQEEEASSGAAARQLQASLGCPGGAVWYERASVVGLEQPQEQAGALPQAGQGQGPAQGSRGNDTAAASSVRGDVVYGGGGGTVLLFEAGSPVPKHAWMLPRYSTAWYFRSMMALQ